MANLNHANQKQMIYEEIPAKYKSGMSMLLLNIFLMLVAIGVFILGIIMENALGTVIAVAGLLYFSVIGPILLGGLKVLKPNEAYVLTLFGRYYGTLRGAGFYFVNPFVSALQSGSPATSTGSLERLKAYLPSQRVHRRGRSCIEHLQIRKEKYLSRP